MNDDKVQLIVYIEFPEPIPLDEAEELFKLFVGEEIVCTPHTLSFGAMYAVELSDVLVKLDKVFDKYDKCFRLLDDKKALIVKLEYNR